MTALTQTARILSVPPVFDSALAGSLLRAGGIASGNGQDMTEVELGTQAIRRLARSGLVFTFASRWRFADPVRRDLLSTLQRDEPAVYQSVAAAVIHGIFNGSGRMMAGALGEQGAQLTAAVLGLAAAGQTEAKAFETLVDALGTSSSKGRLGDAEAVSRLMQNLPTSSDRDRQLHFVNGFSAWNERRRREAAKHLAVVWHARIEDKAYGISAHLLAAFEQGQRKPESAYHFAQEAVRVLSKLGDIRGQALALTTLGRVERDLVDSSSDLARSLDPIETLERAVEIARGVSPRLAGISLGYLAGTLQHLGRPKEALEVAEEATTLIPRDDEAQLSVLTSLGSLYRSNGRFEESREALRRGIEIADTLGNSLQMAILLNVLAGNERHFGMLSDAIRNARRSVEIGESLGNRHHLSQAYNTLACVLCDTASTPGDLNEALQAAQKSQVLLTELSDRRGLLFIGRTIQQIQKKLAEV